MRSGEQTKTWQRFPCSRHTNSEEMPLLSKKTACSPRHTSDSRGQHGTCSWAACTANITNAMPKAFQGLSLLPTRRNTVYQSYTRTFARCGPCCLFHKRGQCRAGLKHLFVHRRKDNRAFSQQKQADQREAPKRDR